MQEVLEILMTHLPRVDADAEERLGLRPQREEILQWEGLDHSPLPLMRRLKETQRTLLSTLQVPPIATEPESFHEGEERAEPCPDAPDEEDTMEATEML